jgi:DNA-binding MarR family transcriptional regulator
MKELAGHLGITSPSATSLVNRLVKLKWVTRFSDPDNRKLVRLKTAPLGRAMQMKAMEKHVAMMRNILSYLPKSDQSSFARILTNLHAALSKEVTQ